MGASVFDLTDNVLAESKMGLAKCAKFLIHAFKSGIGAG